MQRHKNEKIYPELWELPSGEKESLESSEECLFREISEETGLAVEIIGLISVFDYQIEKEDEVRDSTQINFLVSQKDSGAEVKLSPEHQAFNWLSRGETDNYNLTEATKRVIDRAFIFVSKKRGAEK